ncbi:MAG: penicillin-insensitive murein endopeptidase [Polyangiaceae bacterium]|nr:penicillin-insensitive murein endopeptidase [Polyangiaceae bacterium]
MRARFVLPIALAIAAGATGCAAPYRPRPLIAPPPIEPLPVSTRVESNVDVANPILPTEPPPAEEPALYLPIHKTSVAVAPGRTVLEVEVPAAVFTSIGVFGPQTSLLGFDILDVVSAASNLPIDGAAQPLRARRPLDEDGLLPRIVSFRSPSERSLVRVLVDAAEPVELRRVSTDIVEPEFLPKKGKPPPMFQSPVIGFPVPAGRDDGYFLQAAARYQFARTDVIASLLFAFRKTKSKFRRDPIALADISQWDGIRPATDLGLPRHISHEGGRDVDIALAASDEEPSTVRAHCTGVLIEQSVQGCGPGTVRGFDASRTAYFLGLLFETMPPVEKIFIDDVYLRELRRAAEKLHDKRVLKDPGYEGLNDDGIVRPSPWHTDHLHVRFAGPAGKPAY